MIYNFCAQSTYKPVGVIDKDLYRKVQVNLLCAITYCVHRGMSLRLDTGEWKHGFTDWETFKLRDEKQEFAQKVRVDRVVLIRKGEGVLQ